MHTAQYIAGFLAANLLVFASMVPQLHAKFVTARTSGDLKRRFWRVILLANNKMCIKRFDKHISLLTDVLSWCHAVGATKNDSPRFRLCRARCADQHRHISRHHNHRDIGAGIRWSLF